jgi:hypothetical protein
MKKLIEEARELATENISQPTVFYKDKSQRIMLRLCDALEKERGVMCYYRTDDGKCRKFTDDKYTSYCVDGPCPDETPTNADRIRGMSDEELAAIIAADFTEEKLNYCQNKPECSAILETADGIISDEWCIQCALDWLKAETEGAE